MRQMMAIWTAVAILVCLAGCNTTGAGSSAVASYGGGAAQQDAVSQQATPEQKPESEANASPIPTMDLFVEAHNQAAQALGGNLIDSALTEPLVWGEDLPVEGGFLFDGYSNGYASGVVMFDPNYIRVTGRMSDPEACILEYAAIAAGVTGSDPQTSLEAMRGLVENVESDTWTNGYEVDLGEVELEGVLFTIEIGKQNGVTQFWANPDGLKASLEANELG